MISSLTVRSLIEQVVADTRVRLADVTTASPAFAVALWSPDPGSLYPSVVLVGMEASRAAASSMEPGDAFDATWNAAEYGVEAAESGIETDEAFTRLERAAREPSSRKATVTRDATCCFASPRNCRSRPR